MVSLVNYYKALYITIYYNIHGNKTKPKDNRYANNKGTNG